MQGRAPRWARAARVPAALPQAPHRPHRGYADVPVVKARKKYYLAGEIDFDGELVTEDGWKNPDGYSRARWQIDADAFSRSDGNRLLAPEELARLPWKQVYRLFRAFSVSTPYDHEEHVHIAETLEKARSLPVDFGLIPARSWHPDAWTDITRMRTLNSSQAQRNKQQHLCPLQFDIVDRAIRQFSNPGDESLDPFAGIMTVPYLGRQTWPSRYRH